MEQFQAGETASSLYKSTWPLCLPLEEMMYGQTGADNAPCTVHLFGNGVCSSAAKPQVCSLGPHLCSVCYYLPALHTNRLFNSKDTQHVQNIAKNTSSLSYTCKGTKLDCFPLCGTHYGVSEGFTTIAAIVLVKGTEAHRLKDWHLKRHFSPQSG